MMGYNLPGLVQQKQDLVLSVEILAGIYSGNYTWWNDSVFRELNPDVIFPNKTIQVVARSDKTISF